MISTDKPVGILSFPDSRSYGAVLQMRALYEVVSDLGFDTEIIHYCNQYMRQSRHFRAQQTGSALKKRLRRAGRDFMHRSMYRRFRRFEAQMTQYPQKPISARKALEALSERYAAVICGSDQVWNPEITGSDPSYFLDFCGPDTRKLSYAPSFGMEQLPEAFCQKIRQPLSELDAISVREAKGAELVHDLCGREAQLVLDPVFLISASRWQALENTCDVSGDYLLLYSIHHGKDTLAFARSLAEERGLKLLILGGNALSCYRRREESIQWVPDASPESWLWLIRNAACVVTDSFHGLAFSILFRRSFFIALQSRTNSRLEHLLSTLKLNDQIIRPEMIIHDPDYAEAERVLPELRESSLSFLRQALGAEEREEPRL